MEFNNSISVVERRSSFKIGLGATLRIIFLHFLIFSFTSCLSKEQKGTLLVESLGSGEFEVFRVSGESIFHFVSEQIGYFNEPMQLSAGQYLVLADCSSESIIVYPNSYKKIVTHIVEFIPPAAPERDDKFLIQCNRHEKSQLRQKIAGRFNLNVITGNRKILVGMTSLDLIFHESHLSIQKNPAENDKFNLVNETTPESPNEQRFYSEAPQNGALQETPKKLSLKIAAIRVGRPEGELKNIGQQFYFASPKDGIATVTENQRLGKWLFLLPGRYLIGLYGTESEFDLKENDLISVRPAKLTILTPPEVDLNFAAQIRGRPIEAEINKQYSLTLNEPSFLLPGKLSIRINESNQPIMIELAEDESKSIKLRGVQVDFGCSPWDWTCIGKHTVLIYQDELIHPIISSPSDTPILFLGDQISIGLEGSRDIRQKIDPNNTMTFVRTGRLQIIPNPTIKTGSISDLLRIESLGPPMSGFTLDLPLDQSITIPVIAGQYRLAHYVSSTATDSERSSNGRTVVVEPFQSVLVRENVFISEDKMLILKSKSKNPYDLSSLVKPVRGARNRFQFSAARPE